MDRRAFLKGAAIGATVGALGAYSCSPRRRTSRSDSNKRQPNIVVFLADDMRWDALGAAGNRIIQTPNLDALAADGTLFTKNFVTTSICPTSRASILTGQYARRHKIWDFSTPVSSDLFRSSFPALLRQAGYETAFVGKWGIGGPLPRDQFDLWKGYAGQGYYFDPDGKRQQHLTAFSGGQVSTYLETVSRNKPFCLLFSSKAPHVQDGDSDPFKPDPKFAHLYEQATIPRPPTATHEHFERLPRFLQDSEGRTRWKQRFSGDRQYEYSVKQYYRLITGLDDVLGRVVSILKNRQLYDTTCIVFTSDNGFFLGEHGLAGKWWGYEESIRTPLIIKPTSTLTVQHISAMTLNIDVCSTLMELAGLRVPEYAQGRSLVPLLTGQSKQIRDVWFYEHLYRHPAIARSEGIRTERYKYLTYIDERENGEFLFDLRLDPYEENNLALDPRYRSNLEHKRQLLRQMRRKAA